MSIFQQIFRIRLSRKLFLILSGIIFITLFSGAAAQAQVSIGATNYTTLKAAFDDINAGSKTGAVAVTISGSTTETASATLCASGGSGFTTTACAATLTSSYTSVSITATSTATVSGNFVGPLVEFDGADNVTLDGANLLTISNSDITTNTSAAIRFVNAATGNTVKNAIVQGSSSGRGAINFDTDGATASTGNSNNTVMNCTISPSTASGLNYGVYSVGTSAKENKNITIDNNKFINVFRDASNSGGIFASTNNADWTITNNKIYNTAIITFTAAAPTWGGIQYNTFNSSNASTISGNVIGAVSGVAGSGYTATGSANRFVGIQAGSSGTGTPTIAVQNNTISNITLTTSLGTTSAAAFLGITTNAAAFNITGNTVGSLDGTNPISVTATTTAGAAASAGIQTNTTSAVQTTVSNNNVGSISILGGGTGTTTAFSAIRNIGAAGIPLIISGNTVGGTNADSITVGTNVQVGGIYSSTGVVTVTGNTVRNLTQTGAISGTGANAGIVGIYNGSSAVTGGLSQTISQNTVHSLAATNSAAANSVVTGIYYGATANASNNNTIDRNFIHSLSAASNVATLTGIAGSAGFNVGAGTTYFQNNMIRVGVDKNGNNITAGNIYGITFVTGGSATNNFSAITDNFYNNTVYIGGATTGISAAFDESAMLNFSTGRPPARNVINNIFANAVSTGTAVDANYFLSSTAQTASFANLLNADNNIYYAVDAAKIIRGANATATVGSPTYTPYTFAAFQALAATGREANGQTTTNIADFNLINPTGSAAAVDLHINAPSIAAGAGQTLTNVTNDFDGEARPNPAATNPDAGADEISASTFTAPATLAAGTYTNLTVNGSNPTLGGNVTVNGTVNFTNGIVTTGANTLTFGCNAAATGANSTSFVVGNVVKNYCATGSFTYPVGDNTGTAEYSPLTANVTALAINPSSLTVSVTDDFLPGLNTSGSASRYWTLTEGGDLTADLTFNYTDADVNGVESNYQVYKRESGSTALVSGSTNNPAANTASVTGVTNFSDWGVGAMVVTAASVDVGGRVVTYNGRAISGARIILTDTQGNTRFTQTNSFGYYRFTEVAAGETYIFTVSHKRYRFAQPSQIFSINESLTNINFVASAKNDLLNQNLTYFDQAPLDFDGDGRTDLTAFDPSSGEWLIKKSSDQQLKKQKFGLATDRLVPADYDGDGKCDLAVYRPADGNWYIRLSATNSLRTERLGDASATPVVSDYDGDRKADIAVWQPKKSVWTIKQSSDGQTVEYRIQTPDEDSIPLAADFDTDGKADFAFFSQQTGIWQIRLSSSGQTVQDQFGGKGDVPVMGDFNDDGKADLAIFRPGENIWNLKNTRNGEISNVNLGANGVPATGDYDGDGALDTAIFQQGSWTIRQSTGNFVDKQITEVADFIGDNSLIIP